jgi:hypothetical protein
MTRSIEKHNILKAKPTATLIIHNFAHVVFAVIALGQTSPIIKSGNGAGHYKDTK